MKSENWVFVGPGRKHGGVEAQVRDMARRIAEHGLDKVTIEVVSQETFDLRKRVKELEDLLDTAMEEINERDIRELREQGVDIHDDIF